MDADNANQRGYPIELSMGDSWPTNEIFNSSQQANPPADTMPLPPFTIRDLPKIVLPDVLPPLRHPVPKIPKDKTRVPGEPKPKRRCLYGKYQPTGSDCFSDHEMSVEKDEVKDDNGHHIYDGDTGSTANYSAEMSTQDLEFKI